MKAGSWNHLIVILGQPGTGKSTYAVHRIRELGRKGPAYMLAHDPAWRLPDDANLLRHSSFGEAAAGLARKPGAIHSLSVSDGEKVLEWGIQCANASTRNGGGYPVMVLLDEGVGTPGMSQYRLSERMRDFIATRRHHNVGLIVTAQSPLLIHYQILGLSTEIVMFRLIDERGLHRLETIGVPREMISKVRSLPNYKSLTYRSG